jgi:hypothetical protein
MVTVQNSWLNSRPVANSAKNIVAKFKKVRYDLKAWSKRLSNLSLLISNCNTVICFLDSIEDLRNLFNHEANLRNIVKAQLQTLLHFKNLYWKKRFTNNRVKFGDEFTKYFHAMATISHRRNAIPQILNDDGIWVQDHAGKAGLLWNTYKNRMRVSSGISMHFDLASLITPREDLEFLAKPLLMTEIDNIIKRWPTDKALGPDGFNGLFMKRCWPIIKEDF